MRTNIALDIFLEYKKVLYSSLNFLCEKMGFTSSKGLFICHWNDANVLSGSALILVKKTPETEPVHF